MSTPQDNNWGKVLSQPQQAKLGGGFSMIPINHGTSSHGYGW